MRIHPLTSPYALRTCKSPESIRIRIFFGSDLESGFRSGFRSERVTDPAAMTNFTGALQALTEHLRLVSASTRGRRAVLRWSLLNPDLAGLGDLAGLAESIRRAGPARQDQLLSVMLGLATGDQLAQLVAVAGLGGHLQRIVSRWERAGVPVSELRVLEADLVSQCWGAVQGAAGHLASGVALPQRPALALMTAAWVATRAPRLRDRKSPVQRVPLDEAAHLPSRQGEHPAVELARHLADAVRSGDLDHRSASLVFSTRVTGTTVEQAAAHFAVTPESLRQLRTRAERRLARAVHQAARTTAAA